MMKKILGLALAALVALAFGGATVLPAHDVSAHSPYPVVLVHGLNGVPTDFGELGPYLVAQGYTVYAPQLPSQDNFVNAAFLSSFIEGLNAPKVNLVGGSMGGLSARYYAKYLNPGRVASYTSLDTPQQGDWLACFLPLPNGGQVCPSSWFMTLLNWGDDSAGVFPYTTVLNYPYGLGFGDEGKLDGGACFESVSDQHHLIQNDPQVMADVLAAFDNVCLGQVVFLPVR